MDLYILGCGGHARSIINTVRRIDSNRKIILVDDDGKENEVILSCGIINNIQLKEKREKDFHYIVGIGNNQKRRSIYEKMKNQGYVSENIIAISAIVGSETRIAEAVYIAEKVFIGPETKIGSNTIINTASLIEHECRIGENVHIAPNVTICGRSTIGNNTFVGAGSVVIDKVSIADDVVIGAGSIVIKNITEAGVYVGCPAKRIL